MMLTTEPTTRTLIFTEEELATMISLVSDIDPADYVDADSLTAIYKCKKFYEPMADLEVEGASFVDFGVLIQN